MELITETEIRKNLFSALAAAARGEPVALTYKGTRLWIVREAQPSKLSRMKPRPLIAKGGDATDPELLGTMEAEWEHDWEEL